MSEPMAAPRKRFDECMAGDGPVHGVIDDRTQLRHHHVRVREEQRLHPPSHLLLELTLVDRSNVDPAQALDRGRNVACPDATQHLEPFLAPLGRQKGVLELRIRLCVPRRLAQIGELAGVAA